MKNLIIIILVLFTSIASAKQCPQHPPVLPSSSGRYAVKVVNLPGCCKIENGPVQKLIFTEFKAGKWVNISTGDFYIAIDNIVLQSSSEDHQMVLTIMGTTQSKENIIVKYLIVDNKLILR